MSPERQEARDIELRGRPRPVTRLNRATLSLIVGALSLAVLTAGLFGLRRSAPRAIGPAAVLPRVEHVTHAEGLDSMPHDYASVPHLGSPIGELGRPVRNAEARAGIGELPERPTFRPNPEEDALRAERLREKAESDQAGKSQLFVQLKGILHAASATAPSDAASIADSLASRLNLPSGIPGTTLSGEGHAEPQTAHEEKLSFVNAATDARTYATGTLQTPRSPYQLMAGTIIPAALLTAINSDLPGTVIASVTQNVYDTVTGHELLIPQGARLLGQYDSQVAYGQSRVLLVWVRLIMPDGSSIVLDRLPASDATGAGGLQDRVNWHWARIFEGAAMSTLLGISAQLAAQGQPNGSETVVLATRQSLEDSVNQVGQQITRRNLDIQPTLTIRQGFPVSVIVNKDVVLKPYASSRIETQGEGS